MTIKYLGHAGFRIESKGGSGRVSIVCDPFDPNFTGIKWKRQSADIVCISHNHKDHSYLDGVEDYSFVVDAPGEYEVKGIHIYGVDSFHDDKGGSERGKNTIYLINTQENINITHLGDLGTTLSENQIDMLIDTDILLIPVGGIYTISFKDVMRVIDQLEPRIVIPMHYKTGRHAPSFNNLSTIEDFISASGFDPIREARLTLKVRDNLPEETSLFILEHD